MPARHQAEQILLPVGGGPKSRIGSPAELDTGRAEYNPED
jgi:hypothetical protein